MDGNIDGFNDATVTDKTLYRLIRCIGEKLPENKPCKYEQRIILNGHKSLAEHEIENDQEDQWSDHAPKKTQHRLLVFQLKVLGYKTPYYPRINHLLKPELGKLCVNNESKIVVSVVLRAKDDPNKSSKLFRSFS